MNYTTAELKDIHFKAGKDHTTATTRLVYNLTFFIY